MSAAEALVTFVPPPPRPPFTLHLVEAPPPRRPTPGELADLVHRVARQALDAEACLRRLDEIEEGFSRLLYGLEAIVELQCLCDANAAVELAAPDVLEGLAEDLTE